MSIIEDKEHLFEDATKHLKEELKNIQTGRANPTLVENISVDYYGTKTPLQELAAITTPDSRSILIQPWDKNISKDIEKAITSSNLGINPVGEGDMIRLPIPPLTEERRKELSKNINKLAESAKVSIRNVREEIWRTIKNQKTSGDITEDDQFAFQKKLQEKVDYFNKNIKSISEAKEKEIMTI